jgi:hypothetical protein
LSCYGTVEQFVLHKKSPAVTGLSQQFKSIKLNRYSFRMHRDYQASKKFRLLAAVFVKQRRQTVAAAAIVPTP